MYSFSSQESTCWHESKSKQVVSALATTSSPWARFCSRNSISDPAKPAMPDQSSVSCRLSNPGLDYP
jgi:hypothetical protein